MSLLRFLPESFKERVRARAGAFTDRARLANLRRAGFAPRQIIDAGAYLGHWATMAREIFPQAELLMIEPQPALTARLTTLAGQLGRARLCPVAVGEKPGEVSFLLGESNSRIVDAPTNAPTVRVTVSTLEQLIVEHDFQDCSLLKLDLQGHELSALAGAGQWFGRIEAILTEVSWLPIGNVPTLTAVMARFGERGYLPYDVFGQNHRPLDGALWQSDFIFVRRDSALLGNLSWS